MKNPQNDDNCVAMVEAEMEDGTSNISYLRAKILDIKDDMVCYSLFSSYY